MTYKVSSGNVLFEVFLPHSEMKSILRLSRSPIFLAATLASLLVPSLAVPVLAINHKWERLYTDNQENIWYFDSHIGKSGGYRAYWQRERFRDGWIFDTYYSIECKTKLRRQRQEIRYDPNGKVSYSNTTIQDSLVVVEPNTPDRIVADYICKQ